MNKLVSIILVLLCVSCNYLKPKQKPKAVARVGDTYLFQEDISFLSKNLQNSADSAEVVGNYIDDWVRKQSLLQNARNNLSEQQNFEIDRKVSDYKESLLSHLYETKIVQQQLDTVVSQHEVDDYYEQHKKDFVLAEPILRFIAVKNDQPFNRKKMNEVNKIFKDFLATKNDVPLAEFCSFEIVSCSVHVENFVSQDEFYETFNLSASNKNSISLKSNMLLQYQAGNYYYLYRIIEKKNSGYYPKSYVASEIKELILRRREQDFLEELRANIYETAKIKNQVEIYD